MHAGGWGTCVRGGAGEHACGERGTCTRSATITEATGTAGETRFFELFGGILERGEQATKLRQRKSERVGLTFKQNGAK